MKIHDLVDIIEVTEEQLKMERGDDKKRLETDISKKDCGVQDGANWRSGKRRA